MRKVLTWLVVTLGIAALVRKLRRRQEPVLEHQVPAEEPIAEPAATTPTTEEGDPADELRRKLAETRTEEGEAPPAAEASVEERRAEVYEQGRATLDEMQPPDEG